MGEEEDESSILYDLLVPAEWTVQPEPLTNVILDNQQTSFLNKLLSAAIRTGWTLVRSTGIPLTTATRCSLPASLIKLINSQMSWHIALNMDGQLLAVLQDNSIEIRTIRDEFESVIGKCQVPRDTHPQWRQVAWSPDSSMIACSDSRGNVRVFDLMGHHLFTIERTEQASIDESVDLSCAIAGLIFTGYKQTTQWSAELLVINYHGALRCYLVSTTGFQESHTFLFSSYYPQGISCAAYDTQHSLLFIGGLSEESTNQADNVVMATNQGLTAWRDLSVAPYYKLVTDYDREYGQGGRKSLLKRISRISTMSNYFLQSNREQDGIFKMCLSPKGTVLATIHQSGLLGIWDVPSMRRQKAWPKEEQPGLDEADSNTLLPVKKRKSPEGQPSDTLADVNFWSENSLILAQFSGALAVCSSKDLKNKLGDSVEQLDSAPRLTPRFGKGFLALECDTKAVGRGHRHLSTSDSMDSEVMNSTLTAESDEEDEDEDEVSYLSRSTGYIRQVLYFITDSERFQPPRKKTKVMKHTYRLVNLHQTTPQELYARRIQNEEYGEALAVAKRFALDTDLVYQTQWKKHPVSLATIQDYLSKITKRSWVLHECLERVPEDIDAARELLEYGLTGTDLQALIIIGEGNDEGRFIDCSIVEADDSLDASQDCEQNFNEDEATVAARRRRAHQQELIKDVDFSNLNLEQKELINCRLRLLSYLDRLKTYEDIKGGEEMAARLYSEDDFRFFRSRNIVELAVEYARGSESKEVDTLLTFHGKELLPYWLLILNEFPETTPPSEYKYLLPQVSFEPGEEVYEWGQQSFREPDWCEDPEIVNIIHPGEMDPGQEFFEDDPALKQFRAEKLTKDKLQEWYSYRIREIERNSHQVDNALELVKLATEKGVQGLSGLHDDLRTLEVMIYEAEVDPNLTLEDLQKQSNLEKIQLLMEKTSKELYVKNVKRWILPFLKRCEAKTPGVQDELLHAYILSTAKDDLSYCLRIFENCKEGVPNPILTDRQEIVSLALECVYTCEVNEQHANAQKILDCLPKKGFGVIAEDMGALYHDIEQLENHLRAVEILLTRGIKKTPRFIRDSQLDSEKAKNLMIQLTRHASKPELAFKNIDWYHLLEDCIELRDKVYSCIERKQCLEIFVESLLGSEKKANIELAGEFLAKTKQESTKVIKSPRRGDSVGSGPRQPTTTSTLFKLRLSRMTYENSVKLVLRAAKEYFDSSSKLVDPNMDLARACLELITETCPEIQEELDLIQSLSLLNSFSTPVLPLKVRLCEPRLDLVQMALKSSPTAYKSSGKILDLARLVRVYDKDEAKEKGQVHCLIAETALNASDYQVAYQQCTAIIKDKHVDGWKVCKQLAEAKGFENKEARQELIAYSLCHCEPSAFEEILALRTSNELQILSGILGIKEKSEIPEEEVEAMETEDINFHKDSPEKSMLQTALGKTTATTRHVLASTGATTRQVLASTGATTKALLGTMSDATFWKDSLKWVRPLSQPRVKEEIKDEADNVDVQWCHPFYESVVGSLAQSSKEYPDYSQIHWPGNKTTPVYLNETLLRFSLLARSQYEEGEEHITEVLLQLASERLTSDLSLTIAYLLALMKPLAAETFFEKMPRSEITLQMAAYVYALQISAWVERENQSVLATIHQIPCTILIDKVKSHVTSEEASDWPKDLQALAEKFKLHVSLLDDFVQAQTLQNLGRGVDIGRFTRDDDYKQETILGLTMSLEDDVYNLSVSLAKKYNLSLWELYMSHVEFLFSDSGLSTSKIEERIKQLDLLPTLLSQPKDFCTRMQEGIYPLIEGSDHASLLYYFTLLKGSDIEGSVHPPDVHVKLLKKIKSGVPKLDYKQLMDIQADPSTTLTPVLSSSNIHFMSKMASKIPNQGNGNMTSSQIFAIYVKKLFWTGDQGVRKNPESVADWLHRYEACGEFFSKLSAADYATFIKDILFSQTSLQMLELECRQNIIGRALKYAKQKGGSKQKFVADTSEEEVAAICKTFQQYQRHLQSLQTDSVLDLKEIDKEKGTCYYSEYDLTSGDQGAVKQLISNLLCQGESIDLLQALIKVCSLENWTCAMNVRETLEWITESIREAQSEEVTREKMEVLYKVIHTVSKHLEKGGTFVNHNHVLSVLKPFCDNTSVAASIRVEILQLLEKTFDLSGDDSLELLLSQTQALVSSCWTRKVDIVDIEDGAKRQELFQDLLSSSTSFQHLIILSRLLSQWPSFQTGSESEVPEVNPWMMLLESMVQSADFKDQIQVFLEVVAMEQCNTNLNHEETEELYKVLSSLDERLAGWKLVLLCHQESLYDQLITDLQDVTEVSHSHCDPQFYDLIISSHLTPRIIQTAFYPSMVDYILQMEDAQLQNEIVESVAKELNEAGFKTEGAALLLQFRGTQPMFYTLDTALSVVSKWFQKR
ncbi:Neuroblastoma-amplified sequence [Holothuria leucospilota]|uniref:Neuroblastoma-amplified sequence n=1 Tax=Holothuria leucospilota TaxID=206669 RepID=A0A9Q1GY42_HOLLE|nr:Neuroblastoma-amplified sequence [Holothuria leucospilota]